MPRSRRYSSYSSDESPSSVATSSSSDDARSRRSRKKRAPPRRRRGEEKVRSLGKSWDQYPPRYDDSDDSYSSDDSTSPPRRPPRAAAAEPLSPDQQQTKSSLVLFGGIAVAILLVLLGAFALYKYFYSSDSSPGTSSGSGGATSAKVVTVTQTLSGGVVTTTVSTEAAQATGGSSSGDELSSGGSGNSSSGGGSSSSGAIATKQPGLARNNIGIGFLPDYKNQDMAKINEGLGIKSSYYGWYAQLPASGEWDGSQLLSQLDDVKACGCIFQPAVMPTKGWSGLTKDDNSQALAIAKVMKKFTDEGIEVWLRFAHEINWYLTDGTYQGTVEDFKEAWPIVAAAVADNPLVRMFFTPNIAGGGVSDYEKYFPDDLSTEMYDKWCADGKIKFAMGETGTMWVASVEERLAWLDDLTSEATAKAMPHYVGISWFNYDKEQVFYLYDGDKPETVAATKAWIASEGTTAEGAAMGNA
ncbi:hypothetical protein JCM9279_002405 [Rhodotorula babjevae]